MPTRILRYIDLLLFFFFLSAAILTYSCGLIDVPHKDQLGFLIERGFFENDWQWFWHALSWDRSRLIWQDNYALFRPAHMVLLALQDIFLRRHLFAQGIIAVVMYSFAAYSIYYAGRRLGSRLFGFIFGLLFLVQYAGIEAVIWHHITPYILSLTFLIFGLIFLERPVFKRESINLILCGLLNLLATLFNELSLAALAVTGILLFAVNIIARRRGFSPSLNGKAMLIVFFLPVLTNLALNILDYLYYMPHGILGSSYISQGIKSSTPAQALYYVLAPVSSAFLFPFIVNLKLNPVIFSLTWNYFGIPDFILLASSIAIGMLWMGVFLPELKSYARGNRSYLNVTAISFSVMFWVIIAGIGLGRLYLMNGGKTYLIDATYYYSMTGFVLCLISIFFVVRIREKPAFTDFRKKIFNVSVTVLCVLLILMNYFKIQDVLAPLYPQKKIYMEDLETVADGFERNKQYCFAGFYPGSKDLYSYAYRVQNFILLWDYTCKKKDERIPLYISDSPSGDFFFSELKLYGLDEQEFRPAPLKTVRYQKKDIFFTEESYKGCDFKIRFEYVANDRPKTIIMGTAQDNLAFVIQIKKAHGVIKRNGDVENMINPKYIPAKDLRPLHLSVRHFGNSIYLFKDGYVLTWINMPLKEGKIGVYSKRDKLDLPESPPEISVAADCSSNRKATLTLIPKFRIEKVLKSL